MTSRAFFLIALLAITQIALGAWPADDFQKALDIDIQNQGQHYGEYIIPPGPKSCWADRTLTAVYLGSGEWGQNDGDHEMISGSLNLSPVLILWVTEDSVRGNWGNARWRHDSNLDFSTSPLMQLSHSNYCIPGNCVYPPCNPDGSCGYFFLSARYSIHAHKNPDPNPDEPDHE